MRQPLRPGPDLGLAEPLGGDLERLLRHAVLAHASAERRRSYPAILHVGDPRTRELVFPIVPEERIDDALGADVVAAMRSRSGLERPVVWLTRPGVLDVQDVDVRWLRSARRAYAEAGVPLVFVVANRHGWLDPRSGLRRDWKRLRPRSDRSADPAR